MSVAVEVSDKDREVFGRLLDKHYDKILGLVLSNAKDKDEAEDVMQTAVLRAWKNFHKFEVGTNFNAWLSTIALNTFYSKIEKRKNHGKLRSQRQFEIWELSFGQKPVTPEKYCQLTEGLDQRIVNALDSISEGFKETILLREVEEKSYNEISEELDVPVGTVMSRLYRGRRLLKKELEKVMRPEELPRGWEKEFREKRKHIMSSTN